MENNKYNTMRDLPATEKPYEKCERCGAEALTDAELLSVVLRTGSEGMNALDMSRNIIKSLCGGGLAGLHKATVQELRSIRGVGRVKALQIRAITELSRRIAHSRIGSEENIYFNDPYTVGEYFMEDLRHRDQEFVLLLCLDGKKRLIFKEFISKGTVNMAAVTPREIFVCALSHRASSIILLHNHPSGDPSPSREDIHLTKMIADTGRTIGIPLVDHIIIGDMKMVSLREAGKITDR